MSGGSLDHLYRRAYDCATIIQRRTDKALHQAFAAHLRKVARALHELEWVWSGDYSDGDEDAAIHAVLPPHAEQVAALRDAQKALDAAVQHYVDAKKATKEEGHFSFKAHLAAQQAWSAKTFGPGPRTEGVCRHIAKELDEIRAEPSALYEWIDVLILACDGAWRAGYAPEAIIAALRAKMQDNMARKWPDWRTMPADAPIEHIREEEAL